MGIHSYVGTVFHLRTGGTHQVTVKAAFLFCGAVSLRLAYILIHNYNLKSKVINKLCVFSVTTHIHRSGTHPCFIPVHHISFLCL